MPDTRFSGRDLKAERVRAGLTQAELAASLGVARTRITAVEGQIRVAPSFSQRVLSALREVTEETSTAAEAVRD
jgi:DNA-binding XRE family transcriptional regulator